MRRVCNSFKGEVTYFVRVESCLEWKPNIYITIDNTTLGLTKLDLRVLYFS
jgi:hypothetical protein